MLVEFNLSRVISAARFGTSPGTNLTNINNSNSVTVLTPAHVPGTVTVSVDYTMGGSGQTLTDTSLRYTYTPAGVLPRAGGEGVMLALATGMTGMGAVLASRRHRREQHRLIARFARVRKAADVYPPPGQNRGSREDNAI